jgi:hypothetical protein
MDALAMSSPQLDILALEPFYGGPRRAMLETVMRCSRHRWTLLKLPPRRIERRLMAAAHWFAEQLQRHWSGRVDVLFTSEALNLADLTRLVPPLARKPSVVYFHDNQLPDPRSDADGQPTDFVNLNTAAAATEVWFNSVYHFRTFSSRATALVNKHPDIAMLNPLGGLAGKSHVMPPAIDFSGIHQHNVAADPKRPARTIFVETRDADIRLLNAALGAVRRRGEKFELITVGPVEGLDPEIKRRTLPEQDQHAHVNALFESGVFLSARPTATCDFHAVRALAAGCWPIFPRGGVYAEILPKSMHPTCLFEPTVDHMASRIQDAWHTYRPDGYEADLQSHLSRFEPMAACGAMDQRFEELAIGHSIAK